MERNELYYYFAVKTRMFGVKGFERVVNTFESVEGFYAASEKELINSGIFTAAQAAYIQTVKKNSDVEREFEAFRKKGIEMITYYSEKYPEKFRLIKSPPLALFLKGNMPPEHKPVVALIGARECSQYGANIARRLGELMAENDISLVSGMARGIDSVSQNGCMDAGGYSLAFLGGGVDVIYPRESGGLYAKLCERGGIISEFTPGTEPLRQNFAMRNRLIAGISDALCVIEAKERSGTMITVDCALEQGKDVYAIPGRITDITSTGTNELIKQGAYMVTDVCGFADEINSLYGGNMQKGAEDNKEDKKKCSGFNQKELSIIKAVDDNSFTIDQMAAVLDIPTFEILGICISLSTRGMLDTIGAGRFKATSCCINLKKELLAYNSSEEQE